jgi:hypothetical protein
MERFPPERARQAQTPHRRATAFRTGGGAYGKGLGYTALATRHAPQLQPGRSRRHAPAEEPH